MNMVCMISYVKRLKLKKKLNKSYNFTFKELSRSASFAGFFFIRQEYRNIFLSKFFGFSIINMIIPIKIVLYNL